MQPLARAAFRTLTMQLSSSFSEQQFTHAKTITSGQRARTGVATLNRRQFVKFNFSVVEEEFNSCLFELDKRAAHHRNLVKDLLKVYEMDLAEIEAELKQARDFNGQLRCSMNDCSRKTKRIRSDESFYACASCPDFDMCIDCYRNKVS